MEESSNASNLAGDDREKFVKTPDSGKLADEIIQRAKAEIKVKGIQKGSELVITIDQPHLDIHQVELLMSLMEKTHKLRNLRFSYMHKNKVCFRA